MKAIEIVNQIKDVLGIEMSEEKVQLASMKLENGTEIEFETLEKDSEVFIKSDEGDAIPMPEGEYILEDSRILVVESEGVIAEIKDAEETPAEEAPEEEAPAEEEVEAADEKAYATKEELEEVKAMIEEMKSILEKEDLSKEEAPKEVEKVEEVEMSSEVVEPIAHNPEALSSHRSHHNDNVSSQLSRIRQMIYKN
jgi:predicted RNA-binding protein